MKDQREKAPNPALDDEFAVSAPNPVPNDRPADLPELFVPQPFSIEVWTAIAEQLSFEQQLALRYISRWFQLLVSDILMPKFNAQLTKLYAEELIRAAVCPLKPYSFISSILDHARLKQDIEPPKALTFLDNHTYALLNHYTAGLLQSMFSATQQPSHETKLFIRSSLAIVHGDHQTLDALWRKHLSSRKAYQRFSNALNNDNNDVRVLVCLALCVSNLPALRIMMHHPVTCSDRDFRLPDSISLDLHHILDTVNWSPLFRTTATVTKLEQVLTTSMRLDERQTEANHSIINIVGLRRLKRFPAQVTSINDLDNIIEQVSRKIDTSEQEDPEENLDETKYWQYIMMINYAWLNPQALQFIPRIVEKISQNPAPHNRWQPMHNICTNNDYIESKKALGIIHHDEDTLAKLIAFFFEHLDPAKIQENINKLIHAIFNKGCDKDTFELFIPHFIDRLVQSPTKNTSLLNYLFSQIISITSKQERATLLKKTFIFIEKCYLEELLEPLMADETPTKTQLLYFIILAFNINGWYELGNLLLVYAQDNIIEITNTEISHCVFKQGLAYGFSEAAFAWFHAKGIDFCEPFAANHPDEKRYWALEIIKKSYEYKKAIKLLHESYQVPLDCQDEHQRNILHYFFERTGHTKIKPAKQLMELLAKLNLCHLLNAADTVGDTPLHCLARVGVEFLSHDKNKIHNFVALLITMGGDFLAQNHLNQTPLMILSDSISRETYSGKIKIFAQIRAAVLSATNISNHQEPQSIWINVFSSIATDMRCSELIKTFSVPDLLQTPSELMALQQYCQKELQDIMANDKTMCHQYANLMTSPNLFENMLSIFNGPKTTLGFFDSQVTDTQKQLMCVLMQTKTFLLLLINDEMSTKNYENCLQAIGRHQRLLSSSFDLNYRDTFEDILAKIATVITTAQHQTIDKPDDILNAGSF